MMTIDEAIQHAEEVANSACNECADDHRQLAKWLKELKHRRDEERHGKMKVKVQIKRKRETIDGDFCEAAFHGEFWYRCKLCGKAYESYSALEENGKEYCPWCNGYGEVIKDDD